MSDCRNDCVEAVRFPARPSNRPGLSRVRYRIGTYSDFRAAILRRLDTDPVLEAWTHRTPDDPAIALIEGASILGDILTFYQELYANEAYLRTAQWRESIADLVRLLGYRLAPGQGGTGVAAFGIKGNAKVAIPAGFALKAQVGAADKPLDFQTSEEATGFPHLSAFNLFRPRTPAQPIAAGPGADHLEIDAVAGARDIESLESVDLQKGDRIMLVPETSMFDVTGTPYTAQERAEILIVSKVETILDRRIITFEGSLVENRGTTVTAYKLGRSFRHFGHNAPAFVTSFDNATQKTSLTATNFVRQIFATHGGTANVYSTLRETEMPLDHAVDDLAVGGHFIVEGATKFDGVANPVPFVVVKTIRGSKAASLVWGNLSGPATMVAVNAKIVANDNILNENADIREIRFHETKGPVLTLRARSAWHSGPFVDAALAYFGRHADAVRLAGRSLMLVGADGTAVSASVTTASSAFSLAGKDREHPWMWPIDLSAKPAPFELTDFEERKPAVTVYGNLVAVTQGKSERDAVLGNGDSRETFQTFKLPKAPLTYLHDSGQTPPEVPELQVYVDGRRWSRVASLFGVDAAAEVYIVREDANDDSWVQFGDGKTGARLPSGLGNVTARYRSGNGAFGRLHEGVAVQAASKLERLDKIWLPDVIAGGAPPEDGANARNAAPGKVQSLDRLVSLRDFETETIALAGVSKARAAWELVGSTPAVRITVLMDTGRALEIGSVQSSLNKSNRCRGPQRFPVIVHQGGRRYLYVHATYALAPAVQEALVTAAIEAALVDESTGLLGLRQRAFGEREYATRIAGAIQNVAGVAWAKVTALGAMLGSGDDPAALTFPASPLPLHDVVPCGSDTILALYPAHLVISLAALPTSEAC